MQISSVKKIIFCGFFVFLGSFCFAQNDFSGMEMPEMPQMPEISGMPQMPSIGGGFYKPEIPNVKNQNKKIKKEITSGETEAVLSENKNTNDFVSSLLSSNSNLTAQDISSLYDYGLFDDISSLTGLTGESSSVNSLLGLGTGTTDSTNILLQQILTSLEELKKENKKSSEAEKESQNDLQEDSQIFKSRNPHILRFKINGYNIMDSISTVFISKPETDGSFLLTADRIYYVNQKQRKETFYILFKAVKSNGSSTTFQVEPEIAQDFKNENSFIYKLAKKSDLVAKKTGNLVVINTCSSSNDMQIDLLIDIDA